VARPRPEKKDQPRFVRHLLLVVGSRAVVIAPTKSFIACSQDEEAQQGRSGQVLEAALAPMAPMMGSGDGRADCDDTNAAATIKRRCVRSAPGAGSEHLRVVDRGLIWAVCRQPRRGLGSSHRPS
jgi:hypothetical protein